MKLENALKGTDRKQLLISISSIALIGFGIFLVITTVDKLILENKETKTLQEESKTLGIKRERLANMDSSDLKNKARIATRAMPDKPQVVNSVNAIRTLAQKYSLSVEQIRSAVSAKSSKEELDQLSKVELNVDLVGPTESIRDFVVEVEDSFPTIRVGTGRLSSEDGTVKINLRLQTFAKGLPVALPGASEQLPDLTEEEKEMLTLLQKLDNNNPVPSSSLPSTTTTNTPVSPRQNPFSL